jgi:hypothetical protein
MIIPYLLNSSNYPSLEAGIKFTKTPIITPDPFDSVRKILFGSNPDNMYINFRLHEYLTILTSTEYAGYMSMVSDLPKYPNPVNSAFLNMSYTHTVNPATLAIVGKFQANSKMGRMSSRILIKKDGSAITTQNLFTQNSRSDSYNADLSTLYTIPDVNFQFKFDSTPTDTLWNIISLAQPDSCTELFALVSNTGINTLASLFRGNGEPMNTFRGLWEQHPIFAYRVSGLLFALAYRTKELIVA